MCICHCRLNQRHRRPHTGYKPDRTAPCRNQAPHQRRRGLPQRRLHNPPRQRRLPRTERRVGCLKEIHNTGIHRSREQQSDRQAARRGSLSLPTLTAGYREGCKALKPRPGTRSNSKRCSRKLRSSYPYNSVRRLGGGKHAKLSVKSV